jgi:hypothetical protein
MLNHNIKIANGMFENVAQFKYLGAIVTNKNFIPETFMRFNSSNASYHSVQNFLSSHLLSKNVKIEIQKTILLPVVQYRCEIGL